MGTKLYGWIKFHLSTYKSQYIVELMVFSAEFMTSSVQIHSRQGYRGAGDPILRNLHLRYGGLVGADDVASLEYRNRFWNQKYPTKSNSSYPFKSFKIL